MNAAFNGAEGNGVGYQERLETRLDDKQATDLLKHRHG
jgi:hypothetical protein